MTTAAPKVVPLALTELVEPLPPLAAFRGRVVDVRPFSIHTQLAQLTLASLGTPQDQQARAAVELKGVWAENAAKRITKGDVLVLTTKGIALLGPRKHGRENAPARVPVRVRFDDGVTGWIQRRDGTEDLIQYKALSSGRKAKVPEPKNTKSKRTAGAAPQPGGNDGATMISTVTAIKASNVAQQPNAKDTPVATLQRLGANRSDSTAATGPGASAAQTFGPISTTDAEASASLPMPPPPPAKSSNPVVHSAPGEGSRSRKRQRREEALGWGLETDDGLTYRALSDLAEFVQTADAPALQTKRASVIALVTHAGEPCPPKQGARIANWYRQLRICDPTRQDEPTELQWYATTQAGLPEVEVGQVLLARNLLLRKLASSAPMLLCGSFSKLAHAVLDPLSARSKNADRALSPMEEVAHPDRLLVVPGPQELAYATRIAEWARRTKPPAAAPAGAAVAGAATHPTGEAPGPSVPVRSHRPLLRIGEIVEGQFCDLIGMVIKLHTPRPLGALPSNSAASLYLSDYTPHPLLHDYPDPSPVTLPGRLTLQVSLFGSTAAPLAPLLDPRTGETKRGRLVWIRNVRIKSNPFGELEGTVVEDTNPRFRSKVSVEVIDLRRKDHQEKWGDRAKEFQKRHREYWSARSLAK
ncbi:hypothetical protein JCM3774_002338 [Rhodotorula dairenensis]